MSTVGYDACLSKQSYQLSSRSRQSSPPGEYTKSINLGMSKCSRSQKSAGFDLGIGRGIKNMAEKVGDFFSGIFKRS